MLCLASWGQYVLGMVIYAKGWPRLSPRHFSSHEVRCCGCACVWMSVLHATTGGWEYACVCECVYVKMSIFFISFSTTAPPSLHHHPTHTKRPNPNLFTKPQKIRDEPTPNPPQVMHALIVSAAGTSAWLTYSLLDRFDVAQCLWAR